MVAKYPDEIVDFDPWVDDNPAIPGSGVDIKAANLNPRDWEIQAIQNVLGPRPVALNTFAEKKSTTSGLQWGYHGGRVCGGNVVRTVGDGYVTVPDNATSYIYYDWGAAVVASSTVGFPERSFPIAEVTAENAQLAGDFSTRDRRTIAIVSAIGGSGGLEIAHAVITADGSTVYFSCGVPAVHSSIMVFVNGILQAPNIHYSVAEAEASPPNYVPENTVVAFNTAPENGDSIHLVFQKRNV